MANWVSVLVLTIFFIFFLISSSSKLLSLDDQEESSSEETVHLEAHRPASLASTSAVTSNESTQSPTSRNNRSMTSATPSHVRRIHKPRPYRDALLGTEWAPKITAPPPSTWRPQWSPPRRLAFHFRPFASSRQTLASLSFFPSPFFFFSLPLSCTFSTFVC